MFEYIIIRLAIGIVIAAAIYHTMNLRLQHQKQILQTEFELDFK